MSNLICPAASRGKLIAFSNASCTCYFENKRLNLEIWLTPPHTRVVVVSRISVVERERERERESEREREREREKEREIRFSRESRALIITIPRTKRRPFDVFFFFFFCLADAEASRMAEI